LGRLLAEEESADGLFTKYVNHFFREVRGEGENDLELWIVFEDSGPSLRSYLYSPMSAGDFVVYQHSYFWTRLRRNAAASSGTKLKDDVSGREGGEDKSVSMLGEEEIPVDLGDTFDPRGTNTTADGKGLMKEVLRQILTAAAYLHSHGIVHR
jgi:serine/threonine protein kinase